MFIYSVTINDVTYKSEQINQTFKIDESLDSAVVVIPFTNRQEVFNRFDNVKIVVSDGVTTRTTYWLIYGDQISIATNYQIRYQHTLALIETTKILEKYACGSLTDTQPLNATQKTLYDVLERIRLLTPFVPYQYVYNTRVFEIDNDLIDYLKTIKAPQFYLDKKNLREAVIEVFKYINAIPRLVYEYDETYGTNIYRLYADFVNQRQLNITPSNENIVTKRLTDYTDDVNGDNYATKVETYLENIIPSEDNTPNIYINSKTEYVSFRSNDIIVGENNIKLILPEKIEKLINIKLITVVSGESVMSEIDINQFCYEKKVYDTLDINGEIGTKRYAFYWEQGSNELDGFNFTNDFLFPVMSLTNILNYVNASLTDWQNVLFKIEYIPRIENMRTEQYREDYNYLKETEIQINQNERINSLFDITNNIYGQIQRIGVDTLSLSKIHKTLFQYDSTHLNGIWSLGDYTSDGYFITKVELIYFSYYVVARYELSKNWNRIAQFIQIDKEFRPYEIALTKSDYTLKREIVMPFAFVEISNTQRMNETTLAKYQNLLTPFMKTFKGSTTYDLPFSMAFLEVNGNTGVLMPISLMAEKNQIKFRFGFNNTVLAGNRLIYSTLTVFEQRQVKYTENDGTLNFANIKLFENYWNYTSDSSLMFSGMRNAARELPYADLNKNALADTRIYEAETYDTFDDFPLPQQIGNYVVALDTNILYIYTSSGYVQEATVRAYKNDPAFELPSYMILKDTSEILGFNLSIPILPYKTEFNRFVIGDMLSKDNGLIKMRTSGKTFYLRSTNALFSKAYTQKFTDTSDQQVLSSSLIVDNYIDLSSIIFEYDNYCIVDSDDNLYLAVNQRNLDGTKTEIEYIYFNFLDKRTEADREIAGEKDINLSINLGDRDLMTVSLIYQDNYILSINMIDSDLITVDIVEVQKELLSFEFRDNDRIDMSITTSYDTAEPTISFVSWTNLGPSYEYTFSIKNEDSVAAEIFADISPTPTTSRGVIAPLASVTVKVLSPETTITVYARSRATDKNYSTVDSAVGTIV